METALSSHRVLSGGRETGEGKGGGGRDAHRPPCCLGSTPFLSLGSPAGPGFPPPLEVTWLIWSLWDLLLLYNEPLPQPH